MPAKSPNPIHRKRPAAGALAAAQAKTKKDQLIALLRRKGGREMAQLVTALGWLPHTVRAALTGLRKSGFAVERVVGEDGRSRYRIAPETGQ